jgi:hypothetical protein
VGSSIIKGQAFFLSIILPQQKLTRHPRYYLSYFIAMDYQTPLSPERDLFLIITEAGQMFFGGRISLPPRGESPTAIVNQANNLPKT